MSLNFAVLQSFEDFDQDLVAYANHYHLDGIISNDMNLTLLAYGRISEYKVWFNCSSCNLVSIFDH